MHDVNLLASSELGSKENEPEAFGSVMAFNECNISGDVDTRKLRRVAISVGRGKARCDTNALAVAKKAVNGMAQAAAAAARRMVRFRVFGSRVERSGGKKINGKWTIAGYRDRMSDVGCRMADGTTTKLVDS